MSPDVIYCARHPRVETALTCASCGTPICPECMVTTPVGMKCPSCGRAKGSPLFRVRPERLLLAALTALAAGAIAGLVGGAIGFFVIFAAVPYGYFAGATILKAAGMKRGLRLEITAGAAMVLGALAVRLIPSLAVGAAALGGLLDPFFWIAVAVSTGCALSRIRYL